MRAWSENHLMKPNLFRYDAMPMRAANHVSVSQACRAAAWGLSTSRRLADTHLAGVDAGVYFLILVSHLGTK